MEEGATSASSVVVKCEPFDYCVDIVSDVEDSSFNEVTLGTVKMETAVKRRKVLNPRVNWTTAETEEFLKFVMKVKDKFERPTAQLFYKQVAAKVPALSYIYWKAMRDKMKNLKTKYKSAIAWWSNTGTGLDAEGKEQTIRENILKLCPHFDALDQIFGEKQSIRPSLIADSDGSVGTNSNMWADMETPEEDEGNGSVVVSPPSMSPPSPGLTSPDPLQNRNATPVRPPSPPDSFSMLKHQMDKNPQPLTKPKSSIAHLHQISQDRLEAMKYKADKEAEAEDKRIQLERDKFHWQQKREEQELELEKKKLSDETRLKQQELHHKFLLEKLKIEKEFELELLKIERRVREKKQD